MIYTGTIFKELANNHNIESLEIGESFETSATFSTPGDYILELTVNDGFGHPEGKTGSDNTLIRVFANDENRLRAHYELNGNTLDSDVLPGGDTHNGTIVDDPGYAAGKTGLGLAI